MRPPADPDAEEARFDAVLQVMAERPATEEEEGWRRRGRRTGIRARDRELGNFSVLQRG